MGTLRCERFPFRELPATQRKDSARRDAAAVEQFRAKCEPFGFVDGISQPVIRGTYKALRGADPIHLVEAGEFILGYPDNRAYLPPGPTLAAIHDPATCCRRGQSVAAFQQQCRQRGSRSGAERQLSRDPPPGAG